MDGLRVGFPGRAAAGADADRETGAAGRNVEVVRRLFSSAVAGTEPTLCAAEGSEAFRETVRWFGRAFGEMRFEEETVLAAGGRIVEHRMVRDDRSLLLQVGALPW